jgi:hypothetical protein
MSEFEQIYPDDDRPKVAMYDSTCSWCGDRIHEGDEIAQDESGDWVHEECA